MLSSTGAVEEERPRVEDGHERLVGDGEAARDRADAVTRVLDARVEGAEEHGPCEDVTRQADERSEE